MMTDGAATELVALSDDVVVVWKGVAAQEDGDDTLQGRCGDNIGHGDGLHGLNTIPSTGGNQYEVREGVNSVHAGRHDKSFIELNAPDVFGTFDKDNNQAVDSDMDDPSGNPSVIEGLILS